MSGQGEEMRGAGVESPMVQESRFAEEAAGGPGDADLQQTIDLIKQELHPVSPTVHGDGPAGEIVNGVDYTTCWHFYRCNKCFALLTRDEEIRSTKSGHICQCGSIRYSPTNPSIAERTSPKVLAYMAKHDFDSWPPEELDAVDEMLDEAPADVIADEVYETAGEDRDTPLLDDGDVTAGETK